MCRSKKSTQKWRKTLTFSDMNGYCFAIIQARSSKMFNDLFNFKKQRSLKESIGFYLFYACLIMGLQGFAMMLGA
ncbi:MAG: hypothetical protein DI551_10205 [Micavibrio aeruginosavorus]|uniref:Uncharacterized protein n=1 Tax=Micavibrio aeruginosavorus TaxID=349221 RepID=A0A2W5MUB9_9BACT|nr:MAG: hypothetical protein DI551_10205 [Micavibrio aeruginosavorus]